MCSSSYLKWGTQLQCYGFTRVKQSAVLFDAAHQLRRAQAATENFSVSLSWCVVNVCLFAHKSSPEMTYNVSSGTLTLSPLSSHSMGSLDPELPDTTLFVSFFRNFQFSLREIKDLQAGISALREFVTVVKAGFSGLWGETVKSLHYYYYYYCCLFAP